MDNNSYHIKMAAWQELQHALKMSRASHELLEYLTSSLSYLLHYSKKYGIRLPEEDKLIEMMNKTLSILYKSPTRNQHDIKHGDNSTEPMR